jgi:hypothetical protein
MSEPRSFLEERITIMLRKPFKSWQLAGATLGCLSLTLGAVAIQVAPPEDIGTTHGGGLTGKQRMLVEVPTDILDGYAGYYEYGGAAFVTVKREGQHLTVEFPGAQSADPLYPESATTFFYMNTDAQVSFATDGNGQAMTATLHQNGGSTPMSRISAAKAQGLRVALETRIQMQTPSPGSEALLRRLITGITAGTPNLEEMNPQLAAVIRKDLPKLQVKLADLGAVQSMRLARVNKLGMDVYEVKHERGSAEWSVELSPSGTLIGLLVPL